MSAELLEAILVSDDAIELTHAACDDVGCDAAEAKEDKFQLETLLLARVYAYELMRRLFGATPNEELLDATLLETTQDVFETFSDATDEYTRVFIGPGALPASPYEAPYTGNHDMALFQENTLVVRHAYEAAGYQPKRVQAIPDDHIAMMDSFMAAMANDAYQAFCDGDKDKLFSLLRTQLAFSEAHMGEWLDTYAASVRNSKAGRKAVLYPQLIEAASAFAKTDRAFLTESSYWVSCQEQFEPSMPAEALPSLRDALHQLQQLSPLGLSDFEMRAIDY